MKVKDFMKLIRNDNAKIHLDFYEFDNHNKRRCYLTLTNFSRFADFEILGIKQDPRYIELIIYKPYERKRKDETH